MAMSAVGGAKPVRRGFCRLDFFVSFLIKQKRKEKISFKI
jgi:hypothetical protein